MQVDVMMGSDIIHLVKISPRSSTTLDVRIEDKIG